MSSANKIDATDISTLPPTRLTLLAFGMAGGAIGMASDSVNFLLLFYYNQVLHLNAALTGAAIAAALVVDAIADPLVGYWSDRTRSRLGRRHPFILAGIIPLTVSYIFVWTTPFDASRPMALCLYLFGVSVLIRLSLTLLDVPTNALVAELTHDYEARTRLATAKVSMQWLMSNLVGIVLITFWLRDAPGAPAGSGLLNRGGYIAAAFWVAPMILVFASFLPFALMRHVPYLRALSQANILNKHGTDGGLFLHFIRTYMSRPVLALLLAATFLAVAAGLAQALWVYFYSMYWGLSSHQLNLIQLTYLVAAGATFVVLPQIARGRDKRRLALVIATLMWPIDIGAIALRVLGLAPANGEPGLLVLLCGHAIIDGFLLTSLFSLLISMMADAVDENLRSSGRRQEGLILAGQTLVTKISTALGTIMGTLVLTVARFPQDSANISAEVLGRLGKVYMPTIVALGVCSLIALYRYDVTRARHEATVADLESRGIL